MAETKVRVLEDAGLERARRALRHASHVHHTATTADGRQAASDALEQAAIAFALAKLKAVLT